VDVFRADLRGANLRYANLSGASLSASNLSDASLREARMDAATVLANARLDSRTLMADVVWNSVPVMLLNWEAVAELGDERAAQRPKYANGWTKHKDTRLLEYTDAVCANRQVATVLRSQGLNEHADLYAHVLPDMQREGTAALDRLLGS
jgi:uncharacterized protein YjbI with pentapeptide repeats